MTTALRDNALSRQFCAPRHSDSRAVMTVFPGGRGATTAMLLLSRPSPSLPSLFHINPFYLFTYLIRTYIHTLSQTHTSTHAQTGAHAGIHASTHAGAHAHMQAHTHTNTHTRSIQVYLYRPCKRKHKHRHIRETDIRPPKNPTYASSHTPTVTV